MKRHALLIGYTGLDSYEEATILGVLKDLDDYKNYLMQPRGGAWNEDEITILNAPTKTLLKLEINLLRAKGIGIAFTVFSGHGGYNSEEQCRELLINKNETILSRELLGIAKKEILICDSCSGIITPKLEQKSQMLALESADESRKFAREKYEELWKECEPQTIRLYASKIGTSAEDDDGGVYTRALLDTLQNCQSTMNIVKAHDDACDLVKLRTLKGDGSYQQPSKQISKVMKFLPGAIV